MSIAIIIDIILRDKNLTKELFAIFGNPGSALAAKIDVGDMKFVLLKNAVALVKATIGVLDIDHVATKTGVYTAVRYNVLNESGVPENVIRDSIVGNPSTGSSLNISIIENIIKNPGNSLDK